MTTQPPPDADADPEDIEEPFDLDPETLEPVGRGDDELDADTSRDSLFDRTFFETFDARDEAADTTEDDITERFPTKSAG